MTDLLNSSAYRSSPYEKLQQLGIVLPSRPAPIGNFVTHVLEGNMLYLSGQGPTEPDGRLYSGRVGDGVTTEQAYQHARLTAINLIAVMHEALGDLSRVRRIVKLLGLVNASPAFAEHHKVINGCSDLMAEVFGESGIHARSSLGIASLPGNITVEIEAIVAVDEREPMRFSTTAAAPRTASI
ncbi:RidA family protein [Paraburkholderia nemoris]|uniref:RidA family protein n=1 Tax=Paraburkholderia nemoris TaxID=2793076 RepID=UPI001F44BBEA|nr:RidA family protein [Paraburkholderia nemoris]